MTDMLKLGDTIIAPDETPRLGLHWMPTEQADVWVAVACGRRYTIEPGKPKGWIAYDPAWPGRAIECDSFPAAVLAAQSMADGFDGEPTQYDLERVALTAVAALARALLPNQTFTFRAFGEVNSGVVSLHSVQLESGFAPSPSVTPPSRYRKSDPKLKLVPKND